MSKTSHRPNRANRPLTHRARKRKHFGPTCHECGHYARLVDGPYGAHIICNANPGHVR